MKGGTTPLNAVYEYAEPIDRNGFVFMDSPASIRARQPARSRAART
jgi:altronate dehydratase